jgi:type IV pilus assembly protein PilM
VKLLQFAFCEDQPMLVAAAHVDLPDGDGAADEKSVRESIATGLREGPFVGRRVVSNLGAGEFQMKNIRLPKMPEEELASAVEFEAQERFELAGRPAQIRHLPAGEVRHGNELKEEVIVFVAFDEVVQRRMALLESLRLEPIGLDLSPCAVARSFARFLRRSEDADAVNVFIDVGARGTAVTMTHGTEIAFIKLIEVGGRHLTQAVAKALNLSESQAAALRRRRMRQTLGRRAGEQEVVKQDIDLAVADAVRPIVEQMIRDIQLCLRYYVVTFRGQRPECLTFVGGDAAEPGLVSTIAEEIDIPCIVGHPLRGVDNAALLNRESTPLYQPAWATACGLALKGASFLTLHPTGASRVAQAAGT